MSTLDEIKAASQAGGLWLLPYDCLNVTGLDRDGLRHLAMPFDTRILERVITEVEAYEKAIKVIRGAGCTMQGGLDRLCDKCEALRFLDEAIKEIG